MALTRELTCRQAASWGLGLDARDALGIMTMSEERQHIEENIAVIRRYLTSKFPGYNVTEESVPGRYHQFIVIRNTPFRRYRLKVNWTRLVKPKNTPQRTLVSLEEDLVASWMVCGRGDGYLSW